MAKIQHRRGTAAQWTSANPVLAAGEPGYESDTKRSKIGDGSTAWTTLAYRFDNTTAAQDYAPIGAVAAVAPIAASDFVNSWWCAPRSIYSDLRRCVYQGGVDAQGTMFVTQFDLRRRSTQKFRLGTFEVDGAASPCCGGGCGGCREGTPCRCRGRSGGGWFCAGGCSGVGDQREHDRTLGSRWWLAVSRAVGGVGESESRPGSAASTASGSTTTARGDGQ